MKALDAFAALVKTDLLVPVSVTATAASTSVDISGYEGKGFLVLTCLNTAGTAPTMNVKAQTGALSNGTDAADITGATFTQVTTTGSIQFIAIDFDACKKYGNVLSTIGGTSSPAFTMGVALFGRKRIF